MRLAGTIGSGPGGTDRLRLAVVADVSGDGLHAFRRERLAPDAPIKSDGWAGYPTTSAARMAARRRVIRYSAISDECLP